MDPTSKLEFSGQRWAARLLWTLVGAALLSWAFELENGAPRYWWAALLALVAGLWGLGTAVASWLPDEATGDRRLREVLAWSTALLTVVCIRRLGCARSSTEPRATAPMSSPSTSTPGSWPATA